MNVKQPGASNMTPKKRFYAFAVITIVIFFGGKMMEMSSHQSLTDYQMYEGELNEIKNATTRPDMSKPARPVLYFTIKGLDAQLAISDNPPFDYSVYLNNLKPGDKVKVYYDAHGYITPEGYNPYVYQLEKDGVALLDINKLNDDNRRVAFVMYGIGVLALLGTIWYYRTNVRVK